ncbi:protein-glutamate methylesterase [Adhaeribacter aerolatus]|uniref:protein-glutamate methylesterase n=1 Tax=Adhaeribacter aerolatus TaxID=670289 RepID=A0A512AYQ4_9BACT|nr:chemotaxis protein CheB [Adhaeribacter aerolatus]GEO04845.1 protein-glutamate methylesterase [Adhaeribacter aerolatus]
MTTKAAVNSKEVKKDIIVIGSSAGGIKALVEFVKDLPPDFAASIFVAQHVAPYAESMLPYILSREGPLPAVHPQDGQGFNPGCIYVAPPDFHLLLEDGKILVKRGPKENRFRPSVDALFRSAAYVYGPRVIGVVLSGYLDDGTSGLWSIKRLGGTTIIQDPEDAAMPAMPTNVLEFVEVDHVVPIAALAALLSRLTTEPVTHEPKVTKEDLDRLEIELAIARRDNAFQMGIIEKGELTPFTCPDCHGALTKLVEGNLIRFRCHTGHAYTISALLAEVTEAVESAMFQAMRGLEETNMLLEQLGKQFEGIQKQEAAELFYEKAADMANQAHIIHNSIFQHQLLSSDIQFRKKKV